MLVIATLRRLDAALCAIPSRGLAATLFAGAVLGWAWVLS